jgi:protein disulfide-isomerase A6
MMIKIEILLFVLSFLICGSIQDNILIQNYDQRTDGVVELTQKNFKSTVLNSVDDWLVIFEFSGEDCTYCKDLSKVVKKAVALLKGKKIKVGFVDYMTVEGEKLTNAYGIKRFPFLFLFGSEKENPIKYPFSPASAEDLANTAEFLLKKPKAADGQCGKDTVQNQKSSTYELTDENFEEVVLKCEEPWIVNFYTPNYDLCNQFTPHFEAAAKEFKGRAKFGSLYQLGSSVADKYGALRVCTVKLFQAGSKNRQMPVDFNNGTHSPTISANLIPWTKTALGAKLSAPGINELTSQSVFDSKCKDSGVTSCIIFFSPKPDQCNSDCQRNHKDQLKDMAAEMKAEHWAWFSTTQGKQPAFEQALGIQTYPGISAVELPTKTFSTNRGATTGTKLKEFLKSVSSGILPSKNLPSGGLPPVKASM